MNIDDIEKALLHEANLKICEICGLPYKPYHSRQKTCGSADCKRKHHINYVREHTNTIMAENRELYLQKRREYSRRARAKKKKTKARERQLKELSERWQKQSEFDQKVEKYGLDYGKRSAEKVLETVPKIDVSGFKKEKDNEQELRNKD